MKRARSVESPLYIAGKKSATANRARIHCFQRVLLRADDGSRTRDLRLGKPTLYQLSYVRVEGRF
jgi:hypothetical protein